MLNNIDLDELDKAIIEVVRNNNYITPYGVTKKLEKKYLQNFNWATINNRCKTLVYQKYLDMTIVKGFGYRSKTILSLGARSFKRGDEK